MVNFDETSKIQVNLNSMQGQIGSDYRIPLFKKKKTSESGSSEGRFFPSSIKIIILHYGHGLIGTDTTD